MYLLATNVVSELRCADRADPRVRAWADGTPVGAVFLSTIAATALVHGMTMVTRNVVDFAPTGVALVNPWGET